MFYSDLFLDLKKFENKNFRRLTEFLANCNILIKGGLFMKKAVFSVIFIFLTVLVFGQNLKDYTLVSYYYTEIKGTVRNVEQPKIIKFAVESDGMYLRQEGNGFTYWILDDTKGGIIIEMTAAQAQEITAIDKEKDKALILFTKIDKKTTYKTNIGDTTLPYKLVANRIIPLKEIYGISSSDVINKLPRNFWFRNKNMDEVIKLYLETGKTDADGRIANALKK